MASLERPTFGELLRYYRLQAGLTQETLAERARLSSRAIRALEQGVNRAPRAATLSLLVEAMSLSTEARAALVTAAHQQDLPTRIPKPDGSAAAQMEVLLVGRTRELGMLDEHQAGEGPPLLLLAGEPGIGKSRLLQEAARRGVGKGLRTLQGGCRQRDGQEPYEPILSSLARHLHGLQVSEARTTLRGCAWLVRLFPELAGGQIEALPAWALSPLQERRLMFEAVGRYLGNVAGPAGTLLVLDDLQWAGRDALDLLRTLVYAAPQARLRILAAYRDTEVDAQDALSVLLADLAHARLATQQTIPPLAFEDARHLLAALLGDGHDGRDRNDEQLVLRTGGSPFFLVSCAQALRTDGAASGMTSNPLPWNVRQSVRQRVAALPAVARELMNITAIVGRVGTRTLLSQLMICSEDEALAAFEATYRARLLEELGDDAYQFTHDVIREVVEADLSEARRAVLHRRVAEAPENQATSEALADLLAYHYSHSNLRDKALVYLEQAGDQAQARYATASAEGYYREAARSLDERGQPLEAARVREKLGRLLRINTRFADAIVTLEAAAEAYSAAADLEASGRVVVEISWTHIEHGTVAEALERLEPTLALLAERGPSPALAGLYAIKADALFGLSRMRDALTASDHAEHIARQVRADRHLVFALYDHSVILYWLGRLTEAVEAMVRAIAMAEATGDHYFLCWDLFFLGVIYQARGAFTDAQQATERALWLAVRHGFPIGIVMTTMLRGWATFLRGEWAAARRDLEQAVVLGREVGLFWASVNPPLALGSLCLAEGADDEAAGYLAECERLLLSGEVPYTWRQVTCVLAASDLLAGRPDRARARLAAVLDNAALEHDLAPVRCLMAWALLELGAMVEAAEAAWQVAARAREQGWQVLLIDALRVAALADAQQGHWEKAGGTLQEGLLLARQIGYPYAEALLLQASSEVFTLMGQSESARAYLDQALALFRQLGARTDLKRVVGLLSFL